jgi:hypothetical protein
VGRAGSRTGKSREDPQRRGLAGAVPPQEAEYHARADDEIDVVEGERVAEPLGQAAELDRGRRAHRWSRGP